MFEYALCWLLMKMSKGMKKCTNSDGKLNILGQHIESVATLIRIKRTLLCFLSNGITINKFIYTTFMRACMYDVDMSWKHTISLYFSAKQRWNDGRNTHEIRFRCLRQIIIIYTVSTSPKKAVMLVLGSRISVENRFLWSPKTKWKEKLKSRLKGKQGISQDF